MISTTANKIIYENLKPYNILFTDFNYENANGIIKLYRENNGNIQGIDVMMNKNLSSDYVYYTENDINYCDLTATCNSMPVYSLLSFKLLTTSSLPIPIISATINNEEVQFNTTIDDNISYITFLIPKYETYVITLKLQVSSNTNNIDVNRIFNF